MAVRRLMSELKEINKDPNYFFSVLPNEDNFMEWSFIMIGPPDTFYEGGIFEGVLNFPKEYPNNPPKLKFITNIYHPNIYQNGNVCISILHEGIDEYEYESVNERWNPSQSVNTILLSILSILGCPNFDSPANIDASLEWKKSKDTYKKKIFKLVYETQK